MATSIWKGHISFGMVSFPVKLYAAARSQTIGFHQLHPCDHSRVRQVLYCQAEDKPVARAELVKAFEYEKDRYVVVEQQELDQIAPPSSRVMEVLEFVPAAAVDPVYLDASYYVVPEGAGEKPYALLFEALRRSGYVSIAQLTLHTREHLVLLRPGRFGLLVHTLFYNDEVRSVDEFRTDAQSLTDQELQLAHLLVEALAAPFEPGKYKDTYRENLRALIDAKVRGEEVRLGTTGTRPAAVPDILEALKASLARTKKPVARVQEAQPATRSKPQAQVVAISSNGETR
jgi:DNA end-binding protein Ku